MGLPQRMLETPAARPEGRLLAKNASPNVRFPREVAPPGAAQGSGATSSYFTRPRRTSSIAVMVGFLDWWAKTGALRLGAAAPSWRHNNKPVHALIRVVAGMEATMLFGDVLSIIALSLGL